MTNIVETPAAPVVLPFPALGSANFNDESYAAGSALPGLSAGIHAIGVAAETNARASAEQALAAEQSRQGTQQIKFDAQQIKDAAEIIVGTLKLQAETAASTATAQADQARGYCNTAGSHAETARQHKDAAAGSVNAAAASALTAQQQADRAEDAAASISDGPLTSFNGRTGVVTLQQVDVKVVVPEATVAEMQAGAQAALRLMSPSGVAAAIAAQANLQRVARTANTQLITTDSGRWIDITAGTFTQTFLAPATLGAGWWCYIRNSGTGDITIPASDERTNWIMYPGEMRLFQCDGMVLRTVVLHSFYKTFIASGPFIGPPGYVAFEGAIWNGGDGGAGGSGGRDSRGGVSGNGGAGAPVTNFAVQAAATTTTIVVGAGGAGGAGGSADGNGTVGGAGGISSFGTLVYCSTDQGQYYWGAAGAPSVNYSVNGLAGSAAKMGGGGGGSGAGGDLNTSRTGGAGGTSLLGGSGGAGGAGVAGSTPGNSGSAGASPGGGGGGGSGGGSSGNVGTGRAGGSGGAGARGELRIWGII